MNISLENKIHDCIYSIDPIDLKEMDRVALMKRTDTKYVFNVGLLVELLAEVKDDYSVLEIGGERLLTYNTTYLDTPDYSFYSMHHNGKKNRQKIRYRQYLESHKTYLEVKNKSNKGVTDKKRIQTDSSEVSKNEKAQFLRNYSPDNWNNLGAVAETNFCRITLVNKILPERITIDLKLELKDKQNGQSRILDGICIAEVKQSKFDNESVFVESLKRKKIIPTGFSKYCMAMAFLNPDVKKNLWKKKIREIEKLEY